MPLTRLKLQTASPPDPTIKQAALDIGFLCACPPQKPASPCAAGSGRTPAPSLLSLSSVLPSWSSGPGCWLTTGRQLQDQIRWSPTTCLLAAEKSIPTRAFKLRLKMRPSYITVPNSKDPCGGTQGLLSSSEDLPAPSLLCLCLGGPVMGWPPWSQMEYLGFFSR